MVADKVELLTRMAGESDAARWLSTGDGTYTTDLLGWLKETLGDQVKEVRLSTRLTQSPACLITDNFGMTPALARMYRASGQAAPVGKRILELNPKHPLITSLLEAQKNRGADDSLAETAESLYGTALLAEGDIPDDPAKFAGLLADRLARTV
jgi:molecular chaperone HtpG